MNLSANSLYHFTTEYEIIESILKNGFRYSAPKESLPFSMYPGSPFAIPGIINYINYPRAVCFCDIPLELCNNHREQYGNYVIALSKEWGINNGITPVRYIHYHSPDINNDSYRMMKDSYMLFQQHGNDPFYFYLNMMVNKGEIQPPSEKDINDIPDFALATIMYMSAQLMDISKYVLYAQNFLRDYEGNWTDRVTQNNVVRRFYDEREWRAVSNKDMNDNLTFELKDILDIIVQTEDEKNTLVDFIKDFYKTEPTGSIIPIIKTWKDIQII